MSFNAILKPLLLNNVNKFSLISFFFNVYCTCFYFMYYPAVFGLGTMLFCAQKQISRKIMSQCQALYEKHFRQIRLYDRKKWCDPPEGEQGQEA